MKKLSMLLCLCVSACIFDTTPVAVESAEEELQVWCSQSILRRSALTTVINQFWGYTSECRSVPVGGGHYGYECGLPEAYIPDRDMPGWDKAIDRFYTRLIPIGPTLSTTVIYQFDQCGDGRAGDEGYGARTPLDSGCFQAGQVICRCGQPCKVEWGWE